MKEYYIVYVTTNNLNGKIYVGSHATNNLDDGYLGSGKVLKQAIKKYGRESFSREVIATFQTLAEAREFEAMAVREVIEKLVRGSYNRAINGTGAMLGKENSFYGKQHTAETKKVMSALAKAKVGEKNNFYGRKHSQATIDKIKTTKANNPVSKHKLSLAQSKWMWYTPAGVFFSCYAAAKANDLGVNLIKNWCRDSDKLVAPNYQVPEKYWGRTRRENGFYRQRHGEV
jgi:group I intron endonuclease